MRTPNVRRWSSPGMTICRYGALLLGCLWLSSCAAPPLSLYTLGPEAVASSAAPLGKAPIVIAVARVTVPDELDTQDIVVRDGSTLRRSRLGRWSSRLSLGITDRVTGRLAERYPTVLITDRPLSETPTDRVLINISRLDVTAGGEATLDADWMVVPTDSARPTRRDRTHVTATGPVATDQDVVTLLATVLDRLASAIELPGLGGPCADKPCKKAPRPHGHRTHHKAGPARHKSN